MSRTKRGVSSSCLVGDAPRSGASAEKAYGIAAVIPVIRISVCERPSRSVKVAEVVEDHSAIEASAVEAMTPKAGEPRRFSRSNRSGNTPSCAAARGTGGDQRPAVERADAGADTTRAIT